MNVNSHLNYVLGWFFLLQITSMRRLEADHKYRTQLLIWQIIDPDCQGKRWSNEGVVEQLRSEASHPDSLQNQSVLFPICLIKWSLCGCVCDCVCVVCVVVCVVVCGVFVAAQLTREGLMPMLSAAWKARVRFRIWKKTKHWVTLYWTISRTSLWPNHIPMNEIPADFYLILLMGLSTLLHHYFKEKKWHTVN